MSDIDNDNNFRFMQGETYNFNPIKNRSQNETLFAHFSVWQSPDGSLIQPCWGQTWAPTQGDAQDVAVREGRRSLRESNQSHFIMIMAQVYAIQLHDDGDIILNKTDASGNTLPSNS